MCLSLFPLIAYSEHNSDVTPSFFSMPFTHIKCIRFEGLGLKYECLWCLLWASQVVLVVKNPPASAGDIREASLIPGSGRSRGGGHGNPLQYSCLENPMDRGAWRSTVHGVANNRTGLSDFTSFFSLYCCYS